MLRKRTTLLAICAFAFGIGLATSAVAACNNTCRLGCERAYRLCSGTECETAYINCYRGCGCALP
ncbi:MAG: hypothetical protein ACREP7_17335 [Lysobacter sp.]